MGHGTFSVTMDGACGSAGCVTEIMTVLTTLTRMLGTHAVSVSEGNDISLVIFVVMAVQ